MATSKFQKKLQQKKAANTSPEQVLPEVAASVATRSAAAPTGTPESLQIRSEIARPSLETDGQIVRVRADEIYELEQVRPEEDFDDEVIAGMVDSMQDFGTLSPPRCFPRDRRGYRVWLGATRVRSMRKRGDEYIEIYIGKPPKDEKQRILGQLIENLQQSGLKPLATAVNFAALKENFGMSGEEIAKAVGKPTAFVSKHMRISSAPEKIKTLLRSRAISDVDLTYSLIQINELNESVADVLISQASEGQTLTRAQVKKQLDELRGRQKSGPTEPTSSGSEISHAKSSGSENQAIDRPPQEVIPPSSGGPHTKPDPVKTRHKTVLHPVYEFDGQECYLLLDKSPDDFGMVWVKTTNGDMHVPASEIRLLGVR